MAFQPIMDLDSGRPFAYEALVRGVDGESAATVLSWVDDGNRYRFDQACRVKAIELASRLGLTALPELPSEHQLSCPTRCTGQKPVFGPRWRRRREFSFPHGRIMFEVTENEPLNHGEHLKAIFNEYRRQGSDHRD
jgi:EAL domain-containing protein (putative c-di-GMP-specific phosphodiesterase class I)